MSGFLNVVVAIPTMPGRERLLAQLLAQVRGACVGAEIVVRMHTDSRQDFPELIEQALRTGRRWILQLEDDVWLAPSFGPATTNVLRYAERKNADAVTLFSRAKRDLAMLERERHFRRQAPGSFCMMQGIALRSAAMAEFPNWAPEWYARHPKHHHAADLLLAAWLSLRKATMYAHVPSLVQHRPVASTLPGRGGHRQSETYRAVFGEVPG